MVIALDLRFIFKMSNNFYFLFVQIEKYQTRCEQEKINLKETQKELEEIKKNYETVNAEVALAQKVIIFTLLLVLINFFKI